MAKAPDLVRKYIDWSPGASAAEARLRDSRIPVWAIVAYLAAAKDDVTMVARDYEIPEVAVRAVQEYYRQHTEAIDDRLAANQPA